MHVVISYCIKTVKETKPAPNLRTYPSGLSHMSILVHAGSARDATTPWYDSDTNTTAAVNTWEDHHSNACGGATRYPSSQ